MKTKLVIFDLAGTTVKHKKEVHGSFIRAFEAEGIEISYEDANDAMGKPKPVAISEILEKNGIVSTELIDKIHDTFQDNIINHYTSSDDVEENDGASEVFKKLKELGALVAIDTGFDRPTTDILVNRLGWKRDDLIDFSCTSDEVDRGRPYPDMVHRIMELSGIMDAKQVMKVGDTPVDLLEGDSAGCGWNVGITTGAFISNDLANYPHTHLIRSLDEILAIGDWERN